MQVALDEARGGEFTSEELSDVIRLAARRQARPSKSRMTFEEMAAVGRELGIDDASIQAAAAEIMRDRRARHRRIRHKMGFMRHLAIYAIVITALACINIMSGPRHLWFLYPAIGWGIGVAIQGASVYFAEKEAMMRETV